MRTTSDYKEANTNHYINQKQFKLLTWNAM